MASGYQYYVPLVDFARSYPYLNCPMLVNWKNEFYITLQGELIVKNFLIKHTCDQGTSSLLLISFISYGIQSKDHKTTFLSLLNSVGFTPK